METIESLSPWFYEFDLGEAGHTTSRLPSEVIGIHRSRLEMVNEAIDRHFTHEELRNATCLDIGCHEGFYSIEAVKRGFDSVLGIDVREPSLVKARYVARCLGLRNVTFRFLDAEMLHPKVIGSYDLTLFLGLLYHVENPMLILRNVFSVTKNLCIIETQVIDEIEGETEWGSGAHKKQPFHGVLALIDETEAFLENSEAGLTRLVMCPSKKALTAMLRQAGFRAVEYIAPPDGAYEQLARGKRVVCVAQV